MTSHPTKTALGTFVAGTLRSRSGEVLARLDSRLDTENRPVLAPGDTGVVVNVFDAGDLEGEVARYVTRPMARAFRRGVAGPPVRLSDVRFDRRRCLVTAVAQSNRRRPAAAAVIHAFSRRGRFVWGEFADIGPLPKGRSHQVLGRVDPHACASAPARVTAYANLTWDQVMRR
jgi:hypothetical protein